MSVAHPVRQSLYWNAGKLARAGTQRKVGGTGAWPRPRARGRALIRRPPHPHLYTRPSLSHTCVDIPVPLVPVAIIARFDLLCAVFFASSRARRHTRERGRCRNFIPLIPSECNKSGFYVSPCLRLNVYVLPCVCMFRNIFVFRSIAARHLREDSRMFYTRYIRGCR